MGGTEYNILDTAQMPTHSHTCTAEIKSSDEKGNTSDPTGAYPAKAEVTIDRGNVKQSNSYSSSQNNKMAGDVIATAIGSAGGGKPVNNMQPFTSLNFIICLDGIFPSRS
jgi:microcystin-dependent protein